MVKIICSIVLFHFVSFCYAQKETEGWFPFAPKESITGSKINMASWLDAPAGKHGFLQMKDDDLQFANGKKIKFWGVNIASNRPFVEAEEAVRWTNFMAAYGINAVRFHKFTWEATDGVYSTRLTDAKWKNFDFFCSKLRGAGIYYAWSHIYGHRVRPADSSRLLAYSEVANTNFPWSHLNGSTASIVNFAEDLQDLNIELTVNMLNHVNPVTGLRYADDPALAYIELQNEDNIFWSAIESVLKQTPTYRALLCQKFSQWLEKKYGSQQALDGAWGMGVLPADESLAAKNIYPQPNHGMFSHESEKAAKAGTAVPRHIADKAAFLYEEQAKFYSRFVNAIRQTGYKGLIVGSSWQAGSGLAHLWNVYADYGVGPIDRHNYSGGGTGHRFVPGKVDNTAAVSAPGSGLLSSGFQQVADRPFFLSEWMSLIPNEWTAESAPLIAAYGLGLQGWDASFSFAMDYPHFTPTVQSGHGVYNVTSPTHLGLYPALAAMIYRNDIRKADIVATRNVSVSALATGQLPFFEKVEQESDVKKLQSVVPLQALAAGRVVLSFNQKRSGTNSLYKLVNTASRIVKAGTGELVWDYRKDGYFTINTKGTEGAVGFWKNQPLTLTRFRFETTNPFAVILATSLHKDKNIDHAKRILITTMARARNTNMQYSADKTALLEVGEPPLLLEPVRVAVTLALNKRFEVFSLDHSGNRTGQKLPVQNGKFLLDGSKYKAIYYEIIAE